MKESIDYDSWADEYYNDFLRVDEAIRQMTQTLKDPHLSVYYREEVLAKRAKYRVILRELEDTAYYLRTRAARIAKREEKVERLIKRTRVIRGATQVIKINERVESLDSPDICSAMDIISYQNYIATSRSNEKQIERMQDVVTELIPTALTERQAQCIQMYFFEGLKMPQIAEILNITVSTVSRNIKGAVNKLNKKAANILSDGTEEAPKVKKKDLLTAKQRACYDLHLEGYKHAYISEKLGISVSTVSRHIKAAEKKLRLVANTTSMDSQTEDFSEIEAMLAQI